MALDGSVSIAAQRGGVVVDSHVVCLKPVVAQRSWRWRRGSRLGESRDGFLWVFWFFWTLTPNVRGEGELKRVRGQRGGVVVGECAEREEAAAATFYCSRTCQACTFPAATPALSANANRQARDRKCTTLPTIVFFVG